MGGHPTGMEQVGLAFSVLNPVPHLLGPTRLPLLLSFLSWALWAVVLDDGEGRGSER